MSAAHLSDELLSAHLDGYDMGAEADAHFATCRVCHARLQALAEASDALATPVFVPAGPREAAVAAAVAAADDPEAAQPGRRAGGAPRWLPAAAAALVVLVGIGVVTQLGGGENDKAATMASGADVTDGGDLGEIDPASLRDRLQAVVEPGALDAGPAAGGQVADESSGGGEGTGGGGGEGVDDSTEAAPSGAPSMALRNSTKGARTGSTVACEQRVAKEYDKGLIGPLVYRASGTWEGRPAFVLTYRVEEPQGELDHFAYVVARDDCSLLNVQAF